MCLMGESSNHHSFFFFCLFLGIRRGGLHKFYSTKRREAGTKKIIFENIFSQILQYNILWSLWSSLLLCPTANVPVIVIEK